MCGDLRQDLSQAPNMVPLSLFCQLKVCSPARPQTTAADHCKHPVWKEATASIKERLIAKGGLVEHLGMLAGFAT